jgi:capsular polysaccharide transport system permease protein
MPHVQKIYARLLRVDRIFMFAVLVPTLLSIVYYGFIATDIYISESHFVVRSPQKPTQSNILGTLLQGTGIAGSAQDGAYPLQDFMLSRDALQALDKELDLRKAFKKTGADVFMHFPGPDFDDSFEALFRYYQKRVKVEFDTVSNIMVLKVNAFSAEDAVGINNRLLSLGEQLINRLNERAQQDSIGFAAAEVRMAENKVREAALAVSGFRTKQSVVDPERQSALQLQGVSKLQDDLIATKNQLSQLQAFTPDNPQIPSLRNRAGSLQSQIDAEIIKVTGEGNSLTNKAAGYDRLALDRVFAEKQLASALASMEIARNEAQRKQLYLERLAQPNKPDVAIEPRRLRNVLMVFVLGLIVWGVVSMLVASIKEHTE